MSVDLPGVNRHHHYARRDQMPEPTLLRSRSLDASLLAHAASQASVARCGAEHPAHRFEDHPMHRCSGPASGKHKLHTCACGATWRRV